MHPPQTNQQVVADYSSSAFQRASGPEKIGIVILLVNHGHNDEHLTDTRREPVVHQALIKLVPQSTTVDRTPREPRN